MHSWVGMPQLCEIKDSRLASMKAEGKVPHCWINLRQAFSKKGSHPKRKQESKFLDQEATETTWKLPGCISSLAGKEILIIKVFDFFSFLLSEAILGYASFLEELGL